jgi:hypothetical protein
MARQAAVVEIGARPFAAVIEKADVVVALLLRFERYAVRSSGSEKSNAQLPNVHPGLFIVRRAAHAAAGGYGLR